VNFPSSTTTDVAAGVAGVAGVAGSGYPKNDCDAVLRFDTSRKSSSRQALVTAYDYPFD
jgi:hypothetical protein